MSLLGVLKLNPSDLELKKKELREKIQSLISESRNLLKTMIDEKDRKSLDSSLTKLEKDLKNLFLKSKIQALFLETLRTREVIRDKLAKQPTTSSKPPSTPPPPPPTKSLPPISEEDVSMFEEQLADLDDRLDKLQKSPAAKTMTALDSVAKQIKLARQFLSDNEEGKLISAITNLRGWLDKLEQLALNHGQVASVQEALKNKYEKISADVNQAKIDYPDRGRRIAALITSFNRNVTMTSATGSESEKAALKDLDDLTALTIAPKLPLKSEIEAANTKYTSVIGPNLTAIAGLKDKILGVFKGQKDEKEISQALNLIPAVVGKFGNRLELALAEAATGGTDLSKTERLVNSAIQLCDEYLKLIDDVPLLQKFSTNKFGAKVDAVTEIKDALGAIKKNLTA